MDGFVTRASGWLVALFAFVLTLACRRSPAAIDAGPTGRPALPGECTAAPALPKSRFAINPASETADRIEIFPSGEIRELGVLVARISGACVVDPAGGVLWSVGADGVVTGPRAARVGAFQRLDTVRDVEGVRRMVGEVLVVTDGWTTALSPDEGGLVLLSTGAEPLARSRTEMEGDFLRARRTALLLLDLGRAFDTPQSAEVPRSFRERRLPGPEECTEAPALPVDALSIDIPQGGRHRRVDLSRQGEVLEAGKVTAKVSGACLVDPLDGLIAAVSPDGVVQGEHEEVLGIFRRETKSGDAGAGAPAPETLLAADGSTTSVDTDGVLLRAAPWKPAAPTTTRIAGDPAAPRRTALLLDLLNRSGPLGAEP